MYIIIQLSLYGRGVTIYLYQWIDLYSYNQTTWTGPSNVTCIDLKSFFKA